jgi:hypothetical protein
MSTTILRSPPRGSARPQQLNLFTATAPSSARVPAPRPCRCGGTTAILESSRSIHAGELRCSECGHHIAWASHALAAEIRSSFVTGRSSFRPGDRP